MTPLHHQIKSILLPLCLENSAKFREAKNNKHEELLKTIYKMGQDRSINTSYQDYICAMLALLLERPEIKLTNKSGLIYDPFTVIKYKGHFVLVVHGSHQYYFDSLGELKEYKSSLHPIATDEEIESYLDGLTGAQLQRLLVNEYTASIFVSLFEETSELVPADALKEDDVAF